LIAQRLLPAVVAAAIGCGPATPVPQPVAAASALTSADPAPPPPPSSQPSAAPAPPPSPPPELPFPPAAFAPPEERTAKAGDGTWAPYVEGARGEPALLYRSNIHPDRQKPQVYVALVAIDLRRVGVHLVAGSIEPPSTTVLAERRPAVVAPADLPKLIAVFNGGFMARHGQWGLRVGSDLFLPPKDDGCTIAILQEGGLPGGAAVRIGTHALLAKDLGEAVTFRQTPPCLVEGGAVNPALLGGEKPRRWGMSESGGLDIRRSAVGLAEGGRTLIYGLGESITPRQMAEAMRAAGAVDVAELDVNWSYTRWLTYQRTTRPGALPEVEETLIPKIKHGPRLYVQKRSERDFFYLTRP
jgi:hypothetical protein